MTGGPILHHYDFSNFSEKIRLVLGRKAIPWDSVVIPSTDPKPDYVALTGGYRRTPALQVGADVYCDTRLIAEVLEELRPEPSLYPGEEPERARGITLAIGNWAESQLLWPIALYITGINEERFPDSFHEDRARLHGRRPPTRARVRAAALRNLAEFRPQLAWIDALLGDRAYLLGDEPGLADFVVYHPLFLLETIGGGPSEWLAPYPRVRSWQERVASIGRGTFSEITPEEALARAFRATPAPLEENADEDPEGRTPGEAVSVGPSDDASGPSTGTLLRVDDARIVILHRNPRVGSVHVHFPRVGYRVRAVDSASLR